MCASYRATFGKKTLIFLGFWPLCPKSFFFFFLWGGLQLLLLFWWAGLFVFLGLAVDRLLSGCCKGALNFFFFWPGGGDIDVVRRVNEGALRFFFFFLFFFCLGGFFFFYGVGGRVGGESVTSSRYWPVLFFLWGWSISAFALLLVGGLTPFFFFFFFWLGGEVSDVSPATGQLVFFGRFSFCPCFGGRANGFFFRGRSVRGKKCYHPAFDWVLGGEH